jgi:hypothetical protein
MDSGATPSNAMNQQTPYQAGRVAKVFLCLERVLVLTLVSCIIARIAAADPPFPPPTVEIAYSRTLRFGARTDPDANQTVVHRVNSEMQLTEMLWSFPRWFRFCEVSNDGNALVVNTDYGSSLPLNIAESHVLLTFIVEGKVVREITIQQLFGNRSNLVHTPTSLKWGKLRAIDENGFAVVDTVVGYFIFEANTGKCVFPPNNHVN